MSLETIMERRGAKPMPESRVILQMDHFYTVGDMSIIQQGLESSDMSDKWDIFWHDSQLYMHRSWTGVCRYVLSFEQVGEDWRLTSATANRNPDEYTEEEDELDARIIIFLIDVLLLRKDAAWPCMHLPEDEQFIWAWGEIGRASMGEHPECPVFANEGECVG